MAALSFPCWSALLSELRQEIRERCTRVTRILLSSTSRDERTAFVAHERLWHRIGRPLFMECVAEDASVALYKRYYDPVTEEHQMCTWQVALQMAFLYARLPLLRAWHKRGFDLVGACKTGYDSGVLLWPCKLSSLPDGESSHNGSVFAAGASGCVPLAAWLCATYLPRRMAVQGSGHEEYSDGARFHEALTMGAVSGQHSTLLRWLVLHGRAAMRALEYYCVYDARSDWIPEDTLHFLVRTHVLADATRLGILDRRKRRQQERQPPH